MKKYTNKRYTYDQYVAIQRHRSDKKWGTQNFDEKLFVKIIDRVFSSIKDVKDIGCMGIRKGNEYTSFKEITKFSNNPTVWGVDINEQVKEVGPHCYCYDFSELPEDWENKFDLLYSNSLDHSFDLDKTLTEWKRVVKNGGYVLLSLSQARGVDKSDIYSFSPDDLFLDEWFQTEMVWSEPGQTDQFNILAKVVK